MADRWILADNSKIPFKVVAEGQKDRLTIKDEETYGRIRRMAEAAQDEISSNENEKK